MVTITELKTHELSLYADGKILAALQCYDAIVAAHSLDYEARLRVADCLSGSEPSRGAPRALPMASTNYREALHPIPLLSGLTETAFRRLLSTVWSYGAWPTASSPFARASPGRVSFS
ncbi:MAG: hypothetical protein GY811_18460 [Myxococcales bacterium]|nr:hypothetical protein [Myxococcales bacterium]